jgi:hypothetical protein
MPLRGGLRLSVFALTCAVGLATASSASANDVRLWVPDGGLVAPFDVYVRPGVELREVSALLAAGSSLASSYRDVPFTSPASDGATPVTAPVAATNDLDGGTVKLRVAGENAGVQRLALRVQDRTPPTAATGGYGSDPSKVLYVTVWGNDTGVGLDRAELFIDDAPLPAQAFGHDDDITPTADNPGRPSTPTTKCRPVPGAGGIPDLPIDNDCLAYGHATFTLDTMQWGDGPHRMTIRVYDAAGNFNDVVRDRTLNITNHPNLGNSSAQLAIGSGNGATPNGANNGGGGSGGVAGETATSCNSPRLSMELSQKPMKISHGAPVLRYAKRYRFRGRLTCVVNGKRRSAPIKTPIELLNVIGKRTYRKGGTTVRKNGALTIILAYKSSRTLVFRYTNPDGRRSQVKLKIRVAKKSR